MTPVLVVLTQAEGDGDSTEVVTLEIHGPDGSLQKADLPVPEATRSGTNAGFFFHRIGIAGPDGRYVLVVGSVSLPVEIRTSTQ
ncbi:hypothetical protein F8M49_00065 [Rhodococcus zopfii]|uniref:Uncharacterized protein n=1 Tax=Rhodococcus zopfii TaxID=43772 RepID=A0ABU3WL74_9NOCA|nr:hypothetical protein [Rhodococcus zopfii]